MARKKSPAGAQPKTNKEKRIRLRADFAKEERHRIRRTEAGRKESIDRWISYYKRKGLL